MTADDFQLYDIIENKDFRGKVIALFDDYGSSSSLWETQFVLIELDQELAYDSFELLPENVDQWWEKYHKSQFYLVDNLSDSFYKRCKWIEKEDFDTFVLIDRGKEYSVQELVYQLNKQL